MSPSDVASANAATTTSSFGQSTVTAASQDASTQVAFGTNAVDATSATDAQFVNVGGLTGSLPAAGTSAASGGVADNGSAQFGANTSETPTGGLTSTSAPTQTATGTGSTTTGGNFVTRALSGVGHMWEGASDTTKLSLLSTALQVGSALLAKPQPQMQFAGVNDKGYGPGTLIHTTNNGFGLGVGGGQQAPTGVPSSLLPPGSAPSAPQLATTGNPGASPTLPGLATAPSTIKTTAPTPG